MDPEKPEYVRFHLNQRLERWLSTRSLVVQRAVRQWPPGCYTLKGNPGHYVILSYTEDRVKDRCDTCVLVHTDLSYLPGTKVTGVPLAWLIPCGCKGKWRPKLR